MVTKRDWWRCETGKPAPLSTLDQPGHLANWPVTHLLSSHLKLGIVFKLRHQKLALPSALNIILCLSLSINNISHNQEQYNPIRPYIKYEGLPINKNTTTRKDFSYSNTYYNPLLWASYHWLMTENWFESSHLDQDWPPETSWLDWRWLFTNLGCQRNLAKLTSILCWRSNRGNSLLDL